MAVRAGSPINSGTSPASPLDSVQSVLSKYATDPAHPIRIIVVNGHVTLYGSVDNTMDKQVAGIRANQVFGAFTVDNQLVVESKSSQPGM